LLPRHARQIRSWRRHGVKIFLFVYDLLPATEPDWFTPQAGRRFKRWLHFLAIYADGAICISSHVRDMLVTWLDQFAPGASTDLSLSTIRLGADIKETLPSKGVSAELVRLEPRLATMRTILMVGTIEPRKAHSDVLAAFEHIWRTERGTDIGLVMVGRSGWKTEGIQGQIREHLEMGRRLFWLDDASDEELDHLYERCSGVLVASLGEGFGLPLIEAARYGLPILARDIPVFREVAPPWSTFFMGREPMVLADVILSWQENAKAGDRNSYVPPTWEDSRDDLFAALNLDAPARLQ
jgi:glycosyltransferase involved in cell wall biosynthesis